MIRMRIKIGLVALALVSGATNVRSQVFEPAEEPRTVRTEGSGRTGLCRWDWT